MCICVYFYMNLKGNLIYRAWYEEDIEEDDKKRLGKNLRLAINNLSCLKYIQDSFKNGNLFKFYKIYMRILTVVKFLVFFSTFSFSFNFIKNEEGMKCENNLPSPMIIWENPVLYPLSWSFH